VDAAATYGQDVEPPVNHRRPAQRAAAGAGESPDAANDADVIASDADVIASDADVIASDADVIASDADVIEMGGHPPRWPWESARGPTISIALVALVAGLLLGFIGGHLQASTGSRATRAATALTTVLPAGDTAISATGSRCAVQLGRTLQLGIEIMNQSDRTVALRQIKPVLPLGGLHAIASQWGTCGSLPEPGLQQATSLILVRPDG